MLPLLLLASTSTPELPAPEQAECPADHSLPLPTHSHHPLAHLRFSLRLRHVFRVFRVRPLGAGPPAPSAARSWRCGRPRPRRSRRGWANARPLPRSLGCTRRGESGAGSCSPDSGGSGRAERSLTSLRTYVVVGGLVAGSFTLPHLPPSPKSPRSPKQSATALSAGSPHRAPAGARRCSGAGPGMGSGGD